jgi:hypothetical protein
MDLQASIVTPRCFVLVRGAQWQVGARSLKTCCPAGASARDGPDVLRTASGPGPSRETNRHRLRAGRMLFTPPPGRGCRRGSHVGGEADPRMFSADAQAAVGSPEVPWQTFALVFGCFPLMRRLLRCTVECTGSLRFKESKEAMRAGLRGAGHRGESVAGKVASAAQDPGASAAPTLQLPVRLPGVLNEVRVGS